MAEIVRASMSKGNAVSQVDACYGQLREWIVTCELVPGARLTERELIAKMGFGRTPVREALLKLSQERLIEVLPRSGYRVRELTRKSIQDFFAVWRTIAPLIARLGIEGMTPAYRQKILDIGKERAAAQEADAATQSRIASAFFNILVAAADNDPLTYICNRLGAEMERIFRLFFSTRQGREWLGPAGEITAFASVTDPNLAAKLIEARVDASEKGMLAFLDEHADSARLIWLPSGKAA